MRLLYESNSYVLESEYEVVLLRSKITGESVVVGDHYGDPTCGFVSNDETYCISCGVGVIVYYLQSTNNPYVYDKQDSQWTEFYRNAISIEAMSYKNGEYVFYDEDANLLDIIVVINEK